MVGVADPERVKILAGALVTLDSLHSLVGVVILIPLANIESDFSLGFGGLILNGVALWFVLRTIRRSGMANNRSGPPLSAPVRTYTSHPRTS